MENAIDGFTNQSFFGFGDGTVSYHFGD